MSVETSARHRAARRPANPLSAAGQAFFGSADRIRRTALVGAASGLALTVATPVALAAPSTNPVDVETISQQARVALDVQPTVVVPDDAQWSIVTAEVTGSKPAPPPPPPVRSTTASRSTARAATTTAAATTANVPAAVSGNAVLSIAFRYVGVPYVSGGSTPAGFDCSGFTQYVYAQLGISLPRSSAAQRYAGTVVPASQAQPGDLVWWPGHVGIYAGDGQYIGARQPGTPLKASPLYRANPTYIRVTG